MSLARYRMSVLDQSHERARGLPGRLTMRYHSTRGAGPVTLDEALVNGIADDGGLYLPEALPTFSVADFTAADTIPQVAAILLAPFFDGSSLQSDLDAILGETFHFPIPLTPLPAKEGNASLLEQIGRAHV